MAIYRDLINRFRGRLQEQLLDLDRSPVAVAAVAREWLKGNEPMEPSVLPSKTSQVLYAISAMSGCMAIAFCPCRAIRRSGCHSATAISVRPSGRARSATFVSATWERARCIRRAKMEADFGIEA
jgi:hypothetical protein